MINEISLTIMVFALVIWVVILYCQTDDMRDAIHDLKCRIAWLETNQGSLIKKIDKLTEKEEETYEEDHI